MIYTGYYSNIQFYMDQGLTPISISGKPPEGYKGLWWKHLAPSWSIFSQWKNGIIDDNQYTQRFFNEILSNLNVQDIVYDLQRIENPILLCYEKTGFCHRHLIKDWLNVSGIDCEEYK